MSVLVFGSVNIDRSFRLPRWIECGETISSLSLTTQAGGKGANQAASLAKAGVNVHLAATIGSDGLWIRKKLESYGVDTSLMCLKDDTFTGTATILLDEKGRNSIVLYGGGNRENDEEYIRKVFSNFREGDWLVIENEINNLPLIIESARERKMRICFNPSPFEDELLSLDWRGIDLIVVNEVEMMQLMKGETGKWEEILTGAHRAYPSSSILLTLGEEGSMFLDRKSGEIISAPAIRTEAVDTTGAGDTFLGYFLSSLIGGLTPGDALKRAAKASSIAVSRAGAMDSIPFSDEVV